VELHIENAANWMSGMQELHVAAFRKFAYCCFKESTADCQFSTANNATQLPVVQFASVTC